MIYPCFVKNGVTRWRPSGIKKKCTKGIFGDFSAFVWGDVQVSFLKKSVFCNFIPVSCVFFTNALALLEMGHVLDSPL